jgi:hypothetical protein
MVARFVFFLRKNYFYPSNRPPCNNQALQGTAKILEVDLRQLNNETDVNNPGEMFQQNFPTPHRFLKQIRLLALSITEKHSYALEHTHRRSAFVLGARSELQFSSFCNATTHR